MNSTAVSRPFVKAIPIGNRKSEATTLTARDFEATQNVRPSGRLFHRRGDIYRRSGIYPPVHLSLLGV